MPLGLSDVGEHRQLIPAGSFPDAAAIGIILVMRDASVKYPDQGDRGRKIKPRAVRFAEAANKEFGEYN